jgi:hypothetical protein
MTVMNHYDPPAMRERKKDIHHVDPLGHSTSHWKDEGCEVAPACLSCPLPQCKYDMTLVKLKEHGIVGGRVQLPTDRREQVKDMLRADMLTLKEISHLSGVSERTVQRLRAEIYDEATEYHHPLTVQIDGKRR